MSPNHAKMSHIPAYEVENGVWMGGGGNIKNEINKEGGAEEGGRDFYLKKKLLKERGEKEKRIVPRNDLIGLFLPNLPQGSNILQRCTDHPIFVPHVVP